MSALDGKRDSRFPGACPVCGSRILGRIGLDQYFCWDCCAQFSYTGSHLRAWEIAADGTLVLQSEAPGLEATRAAPVSGLSAAWREEVSGR